MFCFFIENNNGDVVVFDCGFFGVVVVIDCDGRYRFFYIGFLLKLWLCGICIDVLLYILVCDSFIYSVVMISEDG